MTPWCGDDSYGRSDNSFTPEELDADIEGILRDVVQGVSDVSELEPRYAEILLDKEEGYD
ncbi:hypothetical protein GLU64_00640 [Nanohaloarchaea archaeon]|nr:hypothetical protein [Candidatus Nanohaloarchaea archaeon]